MGLEIKLEELGLANVAGGELDDRFKEALRERLGLFLEQRHLYRTNKDGDLAIKVEMSVEFIFEESGSTLASVDLHVKEPRKKKNVGSVHVNRGKFFHMVEPVQGPLFAEVPDKSKSEETGAESAQGES